MNSDSQAPLVIHCTKCGAPSTCPPDTLRRYSGLTVTRWCDSCRNLFDVLLPRRESAFDSDP